jgi:transcriptional regulator NrdR family protein
MIHLKKNPHPLNVSWLSQLDLGLPEKRVVKKNGATEKYVRSKLAKSIHNACLDATGFIGEAEFTAVNVCKEVEAWLEKKYEVTSDDIRRKAAKALLVYNPRAAYEYEPSKEYQLNKDSYGFVRL